MPQFYFHLRTPGGLERDPFGLERPSLEAAYLEACRTIPDLCVELLHEGTAPLGCTFLICDAAGRELMEVPFGERLHDGRGSGRPGVLPVQRACLSEVRKARALVAEMRAGIADMRASAAEMRASAQRGFALLLNDRTHTDA